MKQISVVVPVYNTSKYIGNFVKSVINQTYKDFELILVNDGSTDDSVIIAENILKESSIEYRIINKENGGQSTARNRGIEEARGKWIVLLDSDDAIQKDYLEIMYSNVENNKADVGICDINSVVDERIFEESKRTNEVEIKSGKEFFKDFILHKISIGPYSLIINKNIIQKYNLKFNEKSRYSEEFIFITELLYNVEKVVHIKEKLYNYCLRAGSVSTGAKVDKILNGYRQIEEYSKRYQKNEDCYQVIYNKYALPRWVLATARFSASSLEYDDYKNLMKKLNAKNMIIKLLTFPSLKIKLASMLFIMSSYLFYSISKKELS